jgi:magnesium-transporting ATPase (P-type)
VHSLGVEPVDHDVMRQPPRRPSDAIINRRLISNVILSAIIIVAGTLWVFDREVRHFMCYMHYIAVKICSTLYDCLCIIVPCACQDG